MLRKLLLALNGDDPSRIEPLLEALRKQLPTDQLATLSRTVDDYDFRAGELATHDIAAVLGISLEAST